MTAKTSNPALTEVLMDWLLATADDQLILAHRDSEWTGHAPILEEDIAIANIAQDELGHANLWYNLLTQLAGETEDYPDRLVFRRNPTQWRNLQLLELPKGDWAFTMLRQHFMDVYEHVWLKELQGSLNAEVAAIAGKIYREELYHLRHSTAWLKRLGLGTPESHRRLQAALDEQWLYAGQMFTAAAHDDLLVAAGIIPALNLVEQNWLGMVLPLLSQCQLTLSSLPANATGRHQHTAYLAELLDDMQQVAKLDLQAEW